MERTIIIIKPDAVDRKLVGRILTRFENKGFTILSMKMMNITLEQAEELYSPHKGKSFFDSLVKFITSGPSVAVILEGNSAINVIRLMIGSTKSSDAIPGTIRGDFGLGLKHNIIHASDSKENYQRESKIIFK